MKKFKFFGVIAIALAMVFSSFTKKVDLPCPNANEVFVVFTGGPGDEFTPGFYQAIEPTSEFPCPEGDAEICGFCVDKSLISETDDITLTEFPDNGVENDIDDFVNNGGAGAPYTDLLLKAARP
jgi:hypothetical protein